MISLALIKKKVNIKWHTEP